MSTDDEYSCDESDMILGTPPSYSDDETQEGGGVVTAAATAVVEEEEESEEYFDCTNAIQTALQAYPCDPHGEIDVNFLECTLKQITDEIHDSAIWWLTPNQQERIKLTGCPIRPQNLLNVSALLDTVYDWIINSRDLTLYGYLTRYYLPYQITSHELLERTGPLDNLNSNNNIANHQVPSQPIAEVKSIKILLTVNEFIASLDNILKDAKNNNSGETDLPEETMDTLRSLGCPVFPTTFFDLGEMMLWTRFWNLLPACDVSQKCTYESEVLKFITGRNVDLNCYLSWRARVPFGSCFNLNPNNPIIHPEETEMPATEFLALLKRIIERGDASDPNDMISQHDQMDLKSAGCPLDAKSMRQVQNLQCWTFEWINKNSPLTTNHLLWVYLVDTNSISKPTKHRMCLLHHNY